MPPLPRPSAPPGAPVRRWLAFFAVLAAATWAGSAPAADDDAWPGLRAALFAGRPIAEAAGDTLQLSAPYRAEDPATVPIAIRAGPVAEPGVHVRKIYLVVDRNPSPVGAIFTFTPETGGAAIETRVRIEQYTTVRAIAELSDGRLYMASRFVKASGGCSAPAAKDREAAMKQLGRIKLRIDEPAADGRPNRVQLMISHPNDSGLVMDQATRFHIPPRFIRRIDVTYSGRPIMAADLDFTISENPHFRFDFTPRGDGELKAEAVDSNDARFAAALTVSAGAVLRR